MANQPGVMIYFETAKAIKGLDYESKGRLFEAIMEYAEDGVIPAFDGVLSAVWPFIADKIDRDTMRYTDVVTKRKRAQYVRWWNEHAKKNGLDPDDEQLRERWIDNQMYSNDTNVSDVIQTIPTTTATTTPSATTTAINKGIEVERKEGEKGIQGDTRDVFPEENTTVQKVPHSLPAFDPPLTGREEEIFLMAAQTGMGYEKAASLIHRPLKAKEGEVH